MLMRLLVTGSILILGLITLTMYKKEAPDELDAHQQVLEAHEQLAKYPSRHSHSNKDKSS